MAGGLGKSSSNEISANNCTSQLAWDEWHLFQCIAGPHLHPGLRSDLVYVLCYTTELLHQKAWEHLISGLCYEETCGGLCKGCPCLIRQAKSGLSSWNFKKGETWDAELQWCFQILCMTMSSYWVVNNSHLLCFLLNSMLPSLHFQASARWTELIIMHAWEIIFK